MSSSRSSRILDASQSLIYHAVVPKNRKPKFELILKIIDLNNVPLVVGTSFVKWHLPHSAAVEHHGKTPKAPIKDHKVVWEYEKTTQVRVTADKNGLLQSTEIHMEVIQEYHSGPKAERITMGVVTLNLAEYVDASFEREEGITRRYLMQESKINSTIKVSILMKQIEGERTFTAPPLRTGRIFGGIAGIMNQEQGEPDDIGHLPTLPVKSVRDAGEQQDIYRKTLAAAWSSLELPADECIEDIFAGGDGWGRSKEDSLLSDSSTIGEHGPGHNDRLQVPRGTRNTQHRHDDYSRSRNTGERNGQGPRSHASTSESGRASPEYPTPSSSSDTPSSHARRRQNEVSEADVREDLRSWQIEHPPG